jgi:hypothetical protein
VPDLTVPLISKRVERAQFVQKLQHGLPSLFLLLKGLGRLFDEPHGWELVIGLAEVTASVLVIAAFSRGARAMRHHEVTASSAHHSVDWIDLFLGLMLVIEAWSHWHETGHVQRPTLLLAVVMVALGLNHGRLKAFAGRHRAIKIDDVGLSVGKKFFRRFRASWTELAGIDIGRGSARIVRKDGRTCTVDLDDLKNARDVRAALERGRERLLAKAPPEPPEAAPATAQ